jgi:hypothetical protein
LMLMARPSALNVLHGRDRPSPFVSADRDTKSVHIVEVDVINRASLAVSQDDGFPNQLLLGSMQFAEDVQGSLSLVLEPLMHVRIAQMGRKRGRHDATKPVCP